MTMPLGAAAQAEIRAEVRAFIAAEIGAARLVPACDGWSSWFDASFSKRLGEHAWLGMTIPPQYGGHGRSFLERFIVNEELLAAGAPLAAHWIADRQTAPQLLRFGTEKQKRDLLPAIAAGELFVAAGMSEPGSGSDLASLRTTAKRVDGGWVVDGTKLWSSHAQHCHLLVALVRTSPRGEDRHKGLSQLLIDLASPGMSVSPVTTMAGAAHFAEISMSSVFVPDAMVLGREGEGWAQVGAELAFERSGPERFLSVMPLLREAVAMAATGPEADRRELGESMASLWALRLLSEDVNTVLESGRPEVARAALIKNYGTLLERDLVEVSRRLMVDSPWRSERAERLLRHAEVTSPAFTLRGGTNEVLRTIIARAWAR